MLKKLLLTIAFISLISVCTLPSYAQAPCAGAANCFDSGDIQNFSIPSGKVGNHANALADYITIFWETAFILSGLGFLLYLLLGGFRYLMAGGDQKAVMEAKNIIVHAIIGLGIIAASFVIIRIVESIFGLTIITGAIKLPTP